MVKAHRYNMAVIGNCAYLAYIDQNASVQWMCWPKFDDSFVFGALLDTKKGGAFQVLPATEYKTFQRYLPNTNVLETRFVCTDGEFEVLDFAPRFQIHDRFHKPTQFFRKIKLIRGMPRVQIRCQPVGGYGEQRPTVLVGSNHIDYSGLGLPIRLTTNASKSYLLSERIFPLTEDLYFVLSGGAPFEASLKDTFEEFFHRTILYWRDWVKGTYVPQLFQPELIRSALALKIHQYEDTGAIIASGTTSLPEAPASGRNWDYRYCWLRDAYFSLAALNMMGHFAEAQKYSHYVYGVAEDHSLLRPVYSIDGVKDLTEVTVSLAGYLNNQPVRIGNQAFEQVQNDAYGQVLLSLVPLYTDARLSEERCPPMNIVESLIRAIETRIDEPDAGIWEFRGFKRIHLSTAVFHWAGARAATQICEAQKNSAFLERALKLQDRAAALIEQCWSEEHQAYAADTEGKDLDAAGFLLLTLGYLHHRNPRARSHVDALSKGLLSESGYIYRYRRQDDFGDTHSSFLLCHFWYAEALAMLGQIEQSKSEIQKVLQTANHVGLLSEDVDAMTGAQWGNFPQTYSHVGLIHAVFRLARRIEVA